MGKTTSKTLKELLPGVLQSIEKKQKTNPEAVLAYWKEVIGPELSPMTKAVSLNKGTLTVKVKSSTLYSLLYQYEKTKLLKKLQKKFSKEIVSEIFFKLE